METLEKSKICLAGQHSVVHHLVARITEMITTGRFHLGEKLPSEFELMAELHVGRNSLREAMKMLSAMGVVEIRRGDGTYLCQNVKPNIFDPAIYFIMMASSSEQEIIELRQILDESVLSLAVDKATEEDVRRLQGMIDQMRAMLEAGDLSRAAELDYQFHLSLSGCARNPFLSRIVNAVYKLFEGSIEASIRTEDFFAMADQHHQEILDCLRARDKRRISTVIEHSLYEWRKNLRNKIKPANA